MCSFHASTCDKMQHSVHILTADLTCVCMCPGASIACWSVRLNICWSHMMICKHNALMTAMKQRSLHVHRALSLASGMTLMVLYLDHICIHVKHDASKCLYLMLMKTDQQDCLHSTLMIGMLRGLARIGVITLAWSDC